MSFIVKYQDHIFENLCVKIQKYKINTHHSKKSLNYFTLISC